MYYLSVYDVSLFEGLGLSYKQLLKEGYVRPVSREQLAGQTLAQLVACMSPSDGNYVQWIMEDYLLYSPKTTNLLAEEQ